MGTSQNQFDTQDWDWELLIDDSRPQFQNPNSQIQPQQQHHDHHLSFSDGNIIRSDYFSLEFDSNGVSETGHDIEADKSESETGSWLDPDQVQFTGDDITRGDTGRAHFSSDSDSPTAPSDYELGPQNYQNALAAEEETHDEDDANDQNAFAIGEKTHQEEDGDDQNTPANETNEGDENGGMAEIGVENGEDKSENWWKVPLELMRYCVLRVRPVWSLSVAAAAIMGFVLLRRAWLFKIKRKSQNKGLSLNVTVDDKKVSQFMSRAARLNEAFSVVKRVPIIRPSLPMPGLAPWPVISMR